METSIDLDLDDLMEPVDDFDDDLPAMTTLPPLDANDENDPFNTSGQQNAGLLDTLLDPAGEEGGEGAPARRTVNRKPIAKLDATRLTGERGLPVLMKHFEKVKFKGKGHEAADLDKLMRVMEHWAHRLFPKMPFDDVIERIEKLGSKRPVQTCLKKIRMDMPLMDEDFVIRGDDEEQNEGEAAKVVSIPDDDFPTPPLNDTQASQSNSNIPKLVFLTDDQKKRIEENKKRAMERRLAKQQNDAASSQQAPSQTTGLNEAELDDVTMATGGKKTMLDEDGIDSDEAEMEAEMWSQMMEEGKNDGMKKSQQETDVGLSRATKRKPAIEDDGIDSDDAEMENEVWNQMTEPIQTQTDKDSEGDVSQPKSQATTKKSRRIVDDDDDDDVDSDDAKMENEIWNQMTEPIPTQTMKASQREHSQMKSQSATKKSKKLIDDDDDTDPDNLEMDNETGTLVTSSSQGGNSQVRRLDGEVEEAEAQTSETVSDEEEEMTMERSRKRAKKRMIDDDSDED